jgi:membrane protein YdbS with pleckstrin-like domain
MEYRPPQSRSSLAPPWVWVIVIIVMTLIFAWIAGPQNQSSVILSGAVILIAYLGIVFFLRRRRRDDDVDQ